jgi:hypothetical protein
VSTSQIIALAERHAPAATMRSSAELCLSDARFLAATGRDEAARVKALRSLSFSVGVFHADYGRAAEVVA